MEEIYSDIHGNWKKVKSSRLKVELMLAYSKSLQIIEVNGLHFETHLN